MSAAAAVSLKPIRGEVIINRTNAAWESQQVQEPCILPNPKDPARLVMFYSGVPATNRNLCFIGKAWALKSDPFIWHQDEQNPVLSPGKGGWDSGSIRLDAVLYLEGERYHDVRVLRGLPMGLSEAASNALRQWKFRPATRNGVAVPSQANVTVVFSQ